MKTYLPKDYLEQRKWHIVDADGVVLGRLAEKVADVLRGKNKPIFTPMWDAGDFVVVINAEKVKVTGKKEKEKFYMSYSGWRGGENIPPSNNSVPRTPKNSSTRPSGA
jgi:large subunit ribosomal protein L13